MSTRTDTTTGSDFQQRRSNGKGFYPVRYWSGLRMTSEKAGISRTPAALPGQEASICMDSGHGFDHVRDSIVPIGFRVPR
jgi:hypothetical protein